MVISCKGEFERNLTLLVLFVLIKEHFKLLCTLGQLMHNQGIIVTSALLLLGVAFFVHQGSLLRPRERLLLWPQVIKHLVSLLVDDAEMMVGSDGSQGRYRLQVRVRI